MPKFFAYEELTFPEIDALPHDTPLIIPLGEGYDQNRLADSLGQPPKIGMLPPIPFGWSGSGLAVPEPVLTAMLLNLVHSLREDGFTQTFVLGPQDLSLSLGSSAIYLRHHSQHAVPVFLHQTQRAAK